ncbi:MAG: acyl-CoA dehydrogenase family protein, partial [Vulcanimicrobiaceae bacterium]
MDFDLNDEQKAIQALCREFASAEVAPRAEAMDANAAFPYDLV